MTLFNAASKSLPLRWRRRVFAFAAASPDFDFFKGALAFNYEFFKGALASFDYEFFKGALASFDYEFFKGAFLVFFCFPFANHLYNN